MAKISSTSNFKKLPWAFLIALLVIVALYSIELFVLPINFFTFRPNEALKVRQIGSGPFYPGMKVSMIEEGDLAPHTKYAVKKKVEWETDHYGYRKRDSGITRYPIVLIGDSNVAGLGLTQEDMISEVLERRLGVSVYPYYSGEASRVNLFLNDQRFKDNPPDIIIVVTNGICGLADSKTQRSGNSNQSMGAGTFFRRSLEKNPALAVLLDRIYKNNAGRYLAAEIDRMIKRTFGKEVFPNYTVQSHLDPKMLFHKWAIDGTVLAEKYSPQEIEKMAQSIARNARTFKDRGIRVIFFPIPDRENIYRRYLPIESIQNPRFRQTMISRLRALGVEVVDAQKAFEEAARQHDTSPYLTDDSHWSPKGVLISADLLEPVIRLKMASPFKKSGEQISIAMVGDSITNGGQWSKLFSRNDIANHGMNGDTTINVLNRIDSILEIHPKKVFLMIGTNDIGNGVSTDIVVENYEKIVLKLRNSADLFVQSTLFREKWEIEINTRIRVLNERIKSFCVANNITYIDLNSALAPKDYLDTAYTNDGVHLNDEGYLAWKREIEKYF